MPISTVWILKYVQQCYVKWFWTISSLGAPDFFAKTKINIGNFPLRHWKTIVILKIIRFQSLNFTSKPKGYNEIVEKAEKN